MNPEHDEQKSGNDVAGVVLAGGLSSRLGQEKALLRVHGQEQPDLLRRTHNLLTALLPCCWVACRPNRPHLGYDCIFDQLEGLGPFSAVHAALRAAVERGFAAVLTLPCDLPFMDDATLRRLLAARGTGSAGRLLTTFCQRETGFIEALTAVYETAALPLFDATLPHSERKLSRIIPPERQERIFYSQTEALPFFNINYPADLELVRRMLALETMPEKLLP
ncbi:molybdenum cofactor guanylyltransferase [uncultured Desulfovibrio sp.]|uniref:molybdenum cofactor guanylyltransferase n=1 Tax=uncultured Desulfovibrio sp. TaxID=167968 RepID=UPI0003A86618|nr:molybdenum cofactor guanylyltransferase [uncultured Desulfovibrio sp.]